MGEKISLDLDVRTVRGKKVARLRKTGLVPGVVYGQGFEPIHVQVEAGVLNKIYAAAGKHHPVHIAVDGKRKIAMIKDVDRDPVKRTLRHISFHAVKQNEKVTAEAPIVLLGEGESPAERAGLVVLQAIEGVEVKALPNDLPDRLELSIGSLTEAGDHVTIGNISLPAGVEFADIDQDLDLVVASAYEPSALQAANDAAAGAAADESEVEAPESAADQEAGEAEEQPGGKQQKEDKSN